MRIRVQQVKVPLQYNIHRVHREAARRLGCPPDQLRDVTVIRRSLDARPRNPEPLYVLTVEAAFLGTCPPSGDGIDVLPPVSPPIPPSPVRFGPTRPIVVGAGPTGLLAAHTLALAGAKPILLERGEAAPDRSSRAVDFWNRGILNPESNVLYGEGGAGLFSDGKLTARSKERGRVHDLMVLLHACGADESVLVDAEPHIGSDALLDIVPRLRRAIEEAGGEVHFGSRLDGVTAEKGILRAVRFNGREMACDACVLAIGHSARDTVRALAADGVPLSPKPFAVGVRLELPQSAINRAQYGRWAGDPRLGSASFRLTRKEGRGLRPCYTFCMCPGGRVIACASEPGLLTTNGMSYARRHLPRGNAAFLVPVGPPDFPPHTVSALSGALFQADIERRAYTAGGSTYAVPAASLSDFLAGRASRSLPDGLSCRAHPADLQSILPQAVLPTLLDAIPAMLRELRGLNPEDAMVYAAETRSSSPWRFDRSDTGEAIGLTGLFPAGEGAGYAGGIVSSAVDGRRAAEALLQSRR